VTDPVVARREAELGVRNAIARIALLADQGDLDEYADHFTEDSVWDLPGAPRRGREDIRAGAVERRAAGTTGPGTASRHVITTVSVTLESPDRAVADSYFVFLQNTETSPTILNMGVYHDTFVRQGQSWRLARRQITFG
jgi:3-phenylpropionate/cinnamic acid dioxygenase small subunit